MQYAMEFAPNIRVTVESRVIKSRESSKSHAEEKVTDVVKYKSVKKC